MKLLALGLGAALGGVTGSSVQSPAELCLAGTSSLQESVLIVVMVVPGGQGHLTGVVLGAMLLRAPPELLRCVADPLQSSSDGRLEAGVLRPRLIALMPVLTMRCPPADSGRPGGQTDRPLFRDLRNILFAISV